MTLIKSNEEMEDIMEIVKSLKDSGLLITGVCETIISLTCNKTIKSHLVVTLIKSNEELEDIIKIVKSLKDSGFLIIGICDTIQNEAKEAKR